MGTRSILAALGLGLGSPPLEADCTASRFSITSVDSTPIFRVALRASRGGLQQRLTVSAPQDEISTPAEGCLASQTALWTIQGELDEIAYGDAGGAAVFVGAAPLEAGRVYRARVQLVSDGAAFSCAESWSLSWVQGDPQSVIYCRAWSG